MATPIILYARDGKPLLTTPTPWGEVLLSAEPTRVYGNFKSATNSGIQIQSVASASEGQSLFITDFLVSITKKQGAFVTLRLFDGTNIVNLAVIDCDVAANIPMSPNGRTIGWSNADFQLVTDTAGQAATCTVWYVVVTGSQVLSYSKWSSLRG